ncbi:transmembrane O-methyltransferase homolog isoform 1-T1 [Synchiropus picturatus]
MELSGSHPHASLVTAEHQGTHMWLVIFSVPLLSALMSGRCRRWISAWCGGLKAWTLKLLRGHRSVCVRSTHAFVFTHCTHGRADSVLETFDLYSESHPSDWIGPKTGEMLDEVVQRLRPSRVLELGTHCGYTSVRLLRQMPPTGRLVTVEKDPLTAELGEEIIMVAGFKHTQFQVITGSSGDIIPDLHRVLNPSPETTNHFDLVLMDHDPQHYFHDLLALEREELLCPTGSIVLLVFRGPESKSNKQLMNYLTSRKCHYSIHSLVH